MPRQQGLDPYARDNSERTNAERYSNLGAFIERTSGGRYKAENVSSRLAAAHALDKNGNVRNARVFRDYGGNRHIGRRGWQDVAEGGSK